MLIIGEYTNGLVSYIHTTPKKKKKFSDILQITSHVPDTITCGRHSGAGGMIEFRVLFIHPLPSREKSCLEDFFFFFSGWEDLTSALGRNSN